MELTGTVDPIIAEALSLGQRGEWALALAAIERATLAAPDLAEPHLVKGRLLRATAGGEAPSDELAGAILRAFRRACECVSPPARRAEALREYALALEPIGRHREAAAALEEAIDLIASITPPAGIPRGSGAPPPTPLQDIFDLASRAHEKSGEVERSLERHRGAERYYRDVKRDLATWHAREAELLERLGRFADLVRCYARLVDADPDRVLFAQQDAARPSTAQIERHKRLLHGINEYLTEHPNDVVAHGLKAGFFYRLGRYRHAEQLLERAIETAPHHFYAYHLLAKVRLRTGRASKALEAIETARPLAPDYFDIARDRALALELCGRDAEALDAYRRIETRWPGASTPGLGAARRDLMLRAARIREKLGLAEEAYESYRQAAALMLPPEREVLRKLASLAMSLGRPREAVLHLDDIVRSAPLGTREAHADVLLARAEARDASGDSRGALDDLDRVLGSSEPANGAARDGDWRFAMSRKGALLLRRLSRPDDAIACAEALLALDADDDRALVLKGDALKAARRFAESVACYSKAADRQLASALLDEGMKLAQSERPEKALGKYNEAFRRDPTSWEILYCAASAYARLGQAAPAAKYLEAAAKWNKGAIALAEKDGDFEAIRGAREIQALGERPSVATGPVVGGHPPHCPPEKL